MKFVPSWNVDNEKNIKKYQKDCAIVLIGTTFTYLRLFVTGRKHYNLNHNTGILNRPTKKSNQIKFHSATVVGVNVGPPIGPHIGPLIGPQIAECRMRYLVTASLSNSSSARWPFPFAFRFDFCSCNRP